MTVCKTCKDIEVEQGCGETTCYLCREELDALIHEAAIEFGV